MPSRPEDEPLEIGMEFQEWLDGVYAKTPLKLISCKALRPGMTTFNIRHSHRLKFVLDLMVGGKAVRFERGEDIALLPSAPSPQSGDELPGYEESRRQERLPTYLEGGRRERVDGVS
jgi:hypothetical protein